MKPICLFPFGGDAARHRRATVRGSDPRFEDMVRYMESAPEGLAHHFAVEDDELRLKTNIRGGPLLGAELPARP